MTAWAAPGETPTPGQSYEFEDYLGARFIGRVAAWMEWPTDDGVALRIVFDDRDDFITNLPIRFRPLVRFRPMVEMGMETGA